MFYNISFVRVNLNNYKEYEYELLLMFEYYTIIIFNINKVIYLY